MQKEKGLVKRENGGSVQERALTASIKALGLSTIRPDRIVRVIKNELSKSKALQEADRESFFAAVLEACQYGLEPGSVLHHVALVPFRHKASGKVLVQAIIEYRGLLELARRSGQIKRINSQCVYKEELEKGLFEYQLEPPVLKHNFLHDIDRSDKNLVLSYTVCETKDGATYIEVTPRKKIDEIRSRSKAKDSGPWITDYAAMARKTSIRRLLQGGMVPISIEVQEAVNRDAMAEVQDEMETILDVEVVKKPASTISELADQMAQKKEIAESAKPEIEKPGNKLMSYCKENQIESSHIAEVVTGLGLSEDPDEWTKEDCKLIYEGL